MKISPRRLTNTEWLKQLYKLCDDSIMKKDILTNAWFYLYFYKLNLCPKETMAKLIHNKGMKFI
jgi:hypothetical protein